MHLAVMVGASKDKGVQKESLQDLFDTVLEHVPAPQVTLSGGAQMLINNLSYNNFLGRLAIGRVEEVPYKRIKT